MKREILLLVLVWVTFWACETKKASYEEKQSAKLQLGDWKGILMIQNQELPFLFEVVESGESFEVVLKNADERIPIDEVWVEGDSIKIPMYIFDATISAKIGDGIMSGVWTKDYLDDYVIPFEAEHGSAARFAEVANEEPANFTGKWEVDFIEEDGTDKAIGIFQQEGSKATGTFVTSTGDYRFLEGTVNGNQLELSCFDGTHAFLFKANLNEKEEIEGEFWSGKTWHQEWTAKKNEQFELPDPYALTFIKEGYEDFDFAFENTEGKQVSVSSDRYKNKIVVVQILGSWCPNCMDETKFYVEWLKKNQEKLVEVIGLAFERKADKDYAIKRINRMKEKLGMDYEVLIAGTTSQESRAEALPMLNKIMSFPTSIILDKNHKVRKIHTGFSGPGTGEYYEQFVEEFNLLMEKLVEEN